MGVSGIGLSIYLMEKKGRFSYPVKASELILLYFLSALAGLFFLKQLNTAQNKWSPLKEKIIDSPLFEQEPKVEYSTRFILLGMASISTSILFSGCICYYFLSAYPDTYSGGITVGVYGYYLFLSIAQILSALYVAVNLRTAGRAQLNQLN